MALRDEIKSVGGRPLLEESTEQDVENYLEQAGLVYDMTLVCTFPCCSCCCIAVDSDRPCVVLVHELSTESVQNRVDVEQEKMRTCILLDLPVP